MSSPSPPPSDDKGPIPPQQWVRRTTEELHLQDPYVPPPPPAKPSIAPACWVYLAMLTSPGWAVLLLQSAVVQRIIEQSVLFWSIGLGYVASSVFLAVRCTNIVWKRVMLALLFAFGGVLFLFGLCVAACAIFGPKNLL